MGCKLPGARYKVADAKYKVVNIIHEATLQVQDVGARCKVACARHKVLG